MGQAGSEHLLHRQDECVQPFAGGEGIANALYIRQEPRRPGVVNHGEHRSSITGEGARSFVTAGTSGAVNHAQIGVAGEIKLLRYVMEAVARRTGMEEENEFHDDTSPRRRRSSQ